MRCWRLSAMRKSYIRSGRDRRPRLEKLARGGDDALAHFRQRSDDQRTGRLGVAAAAELAGERVDVHVTRAAERHLHLAITKIAEEQRHARSGDRPRMLDDAVEILLTHVVFLERAGGHREPRQTMLVVDAEGAEHLGEQAQT